MAALRRIAEEVADLAAANGGSLSGEHGDGRLRSELLPRMYPPETIEAFAELKRRLDPGRVLNPGVLTDPEPMDSGLRLAASPPRRALRTAMDFSAEGGLARAGGGLQRQRRLPLPHGRDVPELPGPGRRAPLHAGPSGDPPGGSRG